MVARKFLMPLHKIDDSVRALFRESFISLARNGDFAYHPETVFEPPFTFNAESGHDSILTLGAFSYTNSAFYGSELRIGRYCSIGSGLHFGQIEHATTWLTTSNFTYDRWSFYDFALAHGAEDRTRWEVPPRRAFIEIGNDVWIGQNVYLKSGIRVGDGAVVGAHAIVTKDVPPYAIVAGNPARIIRYRFADPVIERLLQIKWWRFAFPALAGIDLTQPIQALDQIEQAEAAGTITGYCVPRLRMADLVLAGQARQEAS